MGESALLGLFGGGGWCDALGECIAGGWSGNTLFDDDERLRNGISGHRTAAFVVNAVQISDGCVVQAAVQVSRLDDPAARRDAVGTLQQKWRW